MLAGELSRADGDHTVAYARYATAFRRYAQVSQKVDAGTLLAPRTRLGMRLRNLLFSTSFLFAPLMRLTDRSATDIELEDYTRGETDLLGDGALEVTEPDGAVR